MIDALIAGKLYGQPTERTSKAGKPFAVAKVRVAAGDGESLFVNVIAFDAAPCTALMALGDGDSVALSGSLTPKDLDGQGRQRPPGPRPGGASSADRVPRHPQTHRHAPKRTSASAWAQQG